MSAPSEIRKGALACAPNRTIFALALAACLLIVAVCSPASIVVIAAHLPPAMLIVLSGLGIGWTLSPVLLPKSVGPDWRLIGGAGIGLGVLSLLMLGLGSVGVMNRAFWLAILSVFAAVGVWRIVTLSRAKSDASESLGAIRWLWMLVVPFAAIAILAASLPPGILWSAEGNGYDVLEYHLGAPREYFEAGRISFLPHNIYSNFPFAVEMLYLLSMIVHGDAVSAGITAQMVNLIIAGLAVAAVWLAGRQVSRSVGVIAATLAATCPFVAYLCGVAYVENALLLYAALALAAVFCWSKDDDASPPRWALLTGLFCGFACGCKYTGIAVVFAPIAIVAIWRLMRCRGKGLAAASLFMLGTLLAFGPWLVRNTINTHNPVFPLARSVFPDNGVAWDDDGAARWTEGHLPAPEDRPLGSRVRRFGTEILSSELFGPLIVLAMIVGAVQILRSIAGRGLPFALVLAAWAMIAVGVVAWLIFSHLVGRFAVTLIVPASLIVAARWESLRRSETRLIGIAIVVLASVLNFSMLVRAGTSAGLFQVAALRAGDGTEWFTDGLWPSHAHVPRINKLTAEGGRVLAIADARRYYLNAGADYCVVFSRNPFAEAAANLSPGDLLAWLRKRGYEHVYVDWGEMSRLRNSRYGFWQSIDRSLFERLMTAGLRHVEDFNIGENTGNYSSLFAVPGVAAPRG
ncbi:hypothetical protein B7486_05215 [cyanobacterium TDX16]|nr:hypothetical protein B7486_05215 [cyanobacterium TDX16]